MAIGAEQAYANLVERSQRIALLGSSAGVLHWDMETYMPSGGAPHRARQVSLISGMTHEMFTAPEMGEWLSTVERSPLVADRESDAAVNVRELRREYDRSVKVPKALVEELSRVTALAHNVWREARRRSDFQAFQPTLERIVELKREQADAIGTGPTRYDALLDGYEPGMTVAEMRRVFDALTAELSPFVERIVASGRTPDRTILRRDYPAEGQAVLGRIVAENIGFDLTSGRIDTSAHPFTISFGPGDTRLTTRYAVHDVGSSLFSVLHEGGHGMYDQGLEPEHYGTPRGEPVSLGIHESQSRMWENFVGRSRSFWEYALPIARGIFPGALSGVSMDAIYWAVNDVRPSFIRVEADEATYNLHVLLRFDLEQRIIGGDLATTDIPAAWNERFAQLLHTTPPDDARGCLQDVHWSGGSFGYFPTYTLGNLYAAQFFAQAQQDLGDLDGMLRRGQFRPLLDWLREKIHRQGMRYRAGDLVRRVTGRPLDHRPLMEHLRTKLSPLYGV